MLFLYKYRLYILFVDEWSTTGHPHYKRLLSDDNRTEAP